MDFNLPTELSAYLAELDDFIARDIAPLQAQDDNERFFDHRREWARTDFDNGGLPRPEWEALLGEARRRADRAGHLRFALPADFGGKDGMTAIVDTFMDNMMADPRTQPFFEGKDLVRIKRELTEQFCVILGGDCIYSGRDMRTTHAGLKIDRNNFNALVEDLQRAMDTHKVPFRSQNKLLAILAPMHREAVTK